MQTSTKLLIFLAVWKRPYITEICFNGIKRLKEHPDYDVQALAVISEEEMIPLCEQYGINWVMYKNEPLGEKKNYGLQKAKEFDFDYLLEIGSDDLITNELLTYYKGFLDYGFFGVKDVAYIDSADGSCRRLQSKSTYGAGRMISRQNLEKLNFKSWKDQINKGMDNNSVFAFMRNGIDYKQVPSMEVPGVIDIKSEVNIWPFNHLTGIEYDKEKIFEKLSEVEVNMIEECYSLKSK